MVLQVNYRINSESSGDCLFMFYSGEWKPFNKEDVVKHGK